MTGDVLEQLAAAMFPEGFVRNDDETGEFIIHTGLKYHPNEDLEDGPLVKLDEKGIPAEEPCNGTTIALQGAADLANELDTRLRDAWSRS